jgi:hypothetical protein
MRYGPIDDICKRFIVYMGQPVVIYSSFIAYVFNIFIKMFT